MKDTEQYRMWSLPLRGVQSKWRQENQDTWEAKRKQPRPGCSRSWKVFGVRRTKCFGSSRGSVFSARKDNSAPTWRAWSTAVTPTTFKRLTPCVQKWEGWDRSGRSWMSSRGGCLIATPRTHIFLMQRDPTSRRPARPPRTPTRRTERRGWSLLKLPEVELGNLNF